MLEIEEIKSRVKTKLSEKRFVHTMGVADEARRLAKRWGADENSAYLAGLVHDYAKELNIGQACEMLKAYNFCITEDLKCCPALLHGPLAAYLAESEFGISDEDILNAITYHTTGRSNMSLLEKIIYLADFIEQGRSFEGVEKVRQLAYEDLDAAVLCEADMVIAFTVEKKAFLHIDTVNTRNYLLCNLKKLKEGK